MHPAKNRHARPRQSIVIPDRVAERAATRYEVEGQCWVSTYSVASHGYAQIGWRNGDYRQMVTAHRAAWVHHAGQQIPEGYTVDHTCKNRRCVNPEHLRVLSNYDNARRTNGRDWPLGQCANGHDDKHLTLADGGRRVRCSICVAEYRRRYYVKKRAQKEATP